MLFNFIKIARRKLWNKKGSTFTKLFSLAIGIVSLFYIAIYLYQELNYDTFHANYAKIVKINTTIDSPTGNLSLGLSAVPVGPYVKAQSPTVEEFVRINKEYGSHAIKYGNKLFSESENIYYADPSFFEVFDFDWVAGNPSAALDGPDKIILTEGTAEKYFGSVNALNKVLLYDDVPFTVSGVIRNLPSNSHLQFDFLISMATFLKNRPNVNENWEWFPMNTYLLLNEGNTNLEQVLRTVPQYLEESNTNDRYTLSFEPLDGLHFSSPKLGELGPKGKRSNLYILFAIGIMILLLAVSNFINLTTAQLTVEAKDVSVKKTIGASKPDIFKQFFVESLLLTALATVLSLVLAFLTFPFFEELMGGHFDTDFLLNPFFISALPLIPLALTLLGGIYPAIKFARISTIHKPKPDGKYNSILNTRTSLLVFQFTITSALVIGSCIIYYQLNYIQNQDLGMDTDHKIVLDYGPNSTVGTAFESLKQELGAIPGVEAVTFSSHVPGQTPNGVATQLLDVNGRSSNGEINLNLVDYSFVENYGLQLVAGRDFRKGPGDETSALILNEAAVKAFGYENPEDILGASFEQWGGNGTVIGVVNDFNYLSLHEEVGLLSLKIWPEQFMKITLTIAPNSVKETLGKLESKWATLYPSIPFNHYFVDDNFKAQYDKDRQFAAIINMFTMISICIGILGLIAYVRFWCERRKKEISIRKVLGASALLLVWKLLKSFSIPVLIGFGIAIPVSYYLGGQWLQEFAYRFDLNWYFFALPMALLLALVWFSVGTQTLKLVWTNPVDNLKEE
ncbi:FtsX-like permease family protein [Ulvibacterium sp.]|uniref:FtsX-like permease family protein n=1 Tax=Ulvibacterium sp. TaxID=2665914 RepID=UPI00261DEF6E|nr:FtsX-like permease family protein [Ulvibacterium sp.]